MYSELDVARFVGPATFTRADAYQRRGLVLEANWSEDRKVLSGRVTGSGPLPYSTWIRMRPGERGQEPLTASCSCPVADRCKHVGALLLEASRAPDQTVDGVAAGWRRALDPILEGLDPRDRGATLGLQFELQLEGQFRAAPGRFARSAPRAPVYTVGVRPVLLGTNGRWRRTGITWRDFGARFSGHEYDERQADVLRELHGLLSETSAYGSPESWLQLDRARSNALWSVLRAAGREGVGLVTGGRAQVPLVVATEVAVPAIDVRRTDDGLVLAPLIAKRSAEHGTQIPYPLALLGVPAVGLAVWATPTPDAGAARASTRAPVVSRPLSTAQLQEAVLTLVPFAAPTAAAAHAFLRLDDPIQIPRAEEAAFLTEHYARLASILPIVSRDGSFAPPSAPLATLSLTIEHGANARLTGRWSWRYTVDDAPNGSARRLPLDPDGTADYRDTLQERGILNAVADAGIDPAATPALILPSTGRLRERFELAGMATVAFVRDVVPALARVPHVEVEQIGEPVEYRPADVAPVVSVGTRSRPGDRDWFDLEIEVRVGNETAPLSEIFLALARGDEFAVLPGGTYFPLDGEAFARLRDLIAEARELTDQPGDALRISRFQSSLWDDLLEVGVVASQADAWTRAVGRLARSGGAATGAGTAGFTASGELEQQPLPEGFTVTLRPYQQAGYDWLSFLYDNALGGVLADDMGLGKTVQALALVARAVAAGTADPHAPRRRFLVVAPTSVVPNWVSEAKKFAPRLRVVSIDETTRKSGRTLASTAGDADLVITSYALFRLDAEAYSSLTWAGLLLDEAQFVKNRHSATHQRVRAFDAPFKLAITGTPMENTLMDLWSILSISAPGLFPSPHGFTEYYQRPIEREGDAERLAQLRRRIRPLMLRRTKEVVAAELPPKLEQTVEVELGPKQRAVYDRYLARERQRVLGLIGDFGKNRFAIFKALTTLRQVALDAALVDPAHEGTPSTKLDLLDELLEDALAEGHRVLVFSQFTRLLGRVRTRLDAADIGYAYLDGSTRRRDEAIDRFRSGTADVFLISLKAGGFGLNLAEADYCILLDPWWNPATEAQAIDRAHRIGQVNPVHVYRLIAKNTVEEKVMALKAGKAELFDAVMADAAGTAGAGITADDVRELLA